MQIIKKNTADIKGYDRNARTHSDEQVRQIANSISEFGFNNPILLDDTNTIIAGHGRLAAAQQLGMQEVPCIILSHLSDAQRRAYILADNKIALNSGWDKSILKAELADLEGIIDLSLLGFGEIELAELLPIEPLPGNTDPDDVPSPGASVCQPGDVWELGRHRLLCGDSTSYASWNQLLGHGHEKLSWVWTDPPYNVNYGNKAAMLNKKNKGGRSTASIINDDLPAAEFLAFLQKSFAALFSSMADGAAIYVAHSETERASFTRSFIESGFKLSTCLIWKKSQMVLGRSDWQYIHEPILYGWKPGAAHYWAGGRKKTTVQELLSAHAIAQEDGTISIVFGDDILTLAADALVDSHPSTFLSVPKPSKNDVHPTMKPVELIERCLRASARPGSIGGDPFGGSGSTLIAAERLGLSSRLIELSPKYCDVIITRWQNFTGEQAVLKNK